MVHYCLYDPIQVKSAALYTSPTYVNGKKDVMNNYICNTYQCFFFKTFLFFIALIDVSDSYNNVKNKNENAYVSHNKILLHMIEFVQIYDINVGKNKFYSTKYFSQAG